ncbi:PREDICTED: probably inactive leucine-rich repeat receptor-like protein kinase IMK2 [Ipomoea nil]|uniref:probably inactive leucine-rich repeat receptor-like protein kinase IMK2 n=1 Tax=Ipomoea nil TaxID=35883 RepID=UPI00090124C5|nr:PREDICTED: probably inactive leucine-rich repeat receptor-like protein kinase IMK2 [Ipomoea nil]
MWKGKEVEYDKNLKFLTIIDLSCNRLVGKIPVDLTDLHGLVSLNLSRNNLTGSIPYKIGQMKLLENLDLSNNQIYGPIPMSMVNLSFLAYLDLSNNNLSGCIPHGTQLQSFNNEAYKGNPELRGPPLLTKCQSTEQGNVPRSQGIVETEEDENRILDFGFFISMGIGFILGFWGVCGTLILKSSWRHCVFQWNVPVQQVGDGAPPHFSVQDGAGGDCGGTSRGAVSTVQETTKDVVVEMEDKGAQADSCTHVFEVGEWVVMPILEEDVLATLGLLRGDTEITKRGKHDVLYVDYVAARSRFVSRLVTSICCWTTKLLRAHEFSEIRSASIALENV